jgi:hypothetical protein
MTLNDQMKNYGYGGTYEMVINLAQEMLVGRGEHFLMNDGPNTVRTRHTKPNELHLD